MSEAVTMLKTPCYFPFPFYLSFNLNYTDISVEQHL